MNQTENKVVGKVIMETMDWSAESLVSQINELNEKYTQPLVLTGTSFENFGAEFQMVILSLEALTEEEVQLVIQETIAADSEEPILELDELNEILEEEIQNYAHEQGNHLKEYQIEQIRTYILENMLPEDIQLADLEIEDEEFKKMDSEMLIKLYLEKIQPSKTDIMSNVTPIIGNAFDFYCNSWLYD